MNSNDIFRKSDLGRQEIKSQSLGVLPREARTLLIMIDGKNTYQNYIDHLNNSKMFAEFGGIASVFELLFELSCIELIEQTNSNILPQSAIKLEQAVPTNAEYSVSQPRNAQPPSQLNTEAEFLNQFNNKTNSQELGKTASLGKFFKLEGIDTSYESIKSDLASYIEKNAPAQDAWGYLLSLEQGC